MSTGEPPPSDRRPPASESDWLRPAQAAELLGLSAAAVRALSEEERLPAFYTPGGHRRYRRRDLDRVRLELDGEARSSA
jgi:excisionase family DNA binding protein